mmetsp:Transcript_65876/g.121432  ORF Transcript_65876/g.121432 Transcript_65876/m.121432 type:complete len:214 (-) Transcript_65876:1513-2154(-)
MTEPRNWDNSCISPATRASKSRFLTSSSPTRRTAAWPTLPWLPLLSSSPCILGVMLLSGLRCVGGPLLLPLPTPLTDEPTGHGDRSEELHEDVEEPRSWLLGAASRWLPRALSSSGPLCGAAAAAPEVALLASAALVLEALGDVVVPKSPLLALGLLPVLGLAAEAAPEDCSESKSEEKPMSGSSKSNSGTSRTTGGAQEPSNRASSTGRWPP